MAESSFSAVGSLFSDRLLREQYAKSVLKSIDFNQALMHGMLSFLLFADSLARQP